MDRVYKRAAQILAQILGSDEEERAVYLYALRVWGSTLINYILIIFCGWMMNCLLLVLVSSIFASAVRIYGGGAHQKRSEMCAFVTVSVHLMSARIVTDYGYVFGSQGWFIPIAAFGFITWSIYRYAPAAAPTKPLTDEEKKRYRKRAIVVYGLALPTLAVLYISPYTPMAYAGILGLTWQAFTMTKSGFAVAAFIDRIADQLMPPRDPQILHHS
ncbi:accessory gene regulator B family protein [Heliobacterium chlorum]|uniref:Accessory gene regulator B family protein n=1 Tax=Heliobacterium chlorum TaxID=2698 RepID=A0ABR7T694_HELCL|nr:accessory gene regulator B family protein [Heliobacterium chlorum]MBC9785364.1 accessory gene regulator B family protein [Heliobacterium chlorum]